MQLPRKMSAQNVMASISRTLGNRNDSKSTASNEVKFAGEESKDKLYEPKHKQKVVRVLTVVAYVISVSLAAIILSLYYTFIWDPRDHAQYTIIRQAKVNVTCVNLTLPTVLIKSPGSNETRFGGITIKSSEVQPEFSEELNQSQVPRRKSFLTILKESTELDESTVSPPSSTIYTTRYPNLEVTNED